MFEGGAECAGALALPFDHVYYTGGQRVGRLVMKAAAEHFAGVTLEMGGKNPAIVDASAAVDNAALKIAWGRARTQGRCVAPDYALVHESRHDEFVAALGAAFRRMYDAEGHGFDQSKELLRIVNDAHFARVQGLLDDARTRRARGGGRRDACGGSLCRSNRADQRDRGHAGDAGGDLRADPAGDRWRDRAKPWRSCDAGASRSRSMSMRRTERRSTGFSPTPAPAAPWSITISSTGTNPRLPFGGVGPSGAGRIGGEAVSAILQRPIGGRAAPRASRHDVQFPAVLEDLSQADRKSARLNIRLEARKGEIQCLTSESRWSSRRASLAGSLCQKRATCSRRGRGESRSRSRQPCWKNAYNAGDVAAVAALYAEDAVLERAG